MPLRLLRTDTDADCYKTKVVVKDIFTVAANSKSQGYSKGNDPRNGQNFVPTKHVLYTQCSQSMCKYEHGLEDWNLRFLYFCLFEF